VAPTLAVIVVKSTDGSSYTGLTSAFINGKPSCTQQTSTKAVWMFMTMPVLFGALCEPETPGEKCG
jgi:hypothetical protein